ncbi:hypothetical protein A6770_35460 [Nostoc minutum NIES-26]|uniref:Uncharacterized protein n=1 Tax=Nostoc minutum NIES-26 TaxID=1844469 RepID=A0A367RZK7_9NOSO|nr:hypothetical protein A6770_35460 [Nostoc minutum NIES-26]
MTQDKRITLHQTKQQQQQGFQINTIIIRKRRTMKRFQTQDFVNRVLYPITISSLIITAFMGVTAMGFWGFEIIADNSRPTILNKHDWRSQKNICLGMMTVTFSVFLGSALLGGCLSSGNED